MITPGGRFTKDRPASRTGGGAGRGGQPGADLGPANCGDSDVCFAGARSRPCRPTPWWGCSSISTWRRRSSSAARGRPGLAAGRRPPPRGRRRRGRVVDQRRGLRPAVAGHALLRQLNGRGLAGRDGGGGRRSTNGPRSSSATRRTASASWTRTARVHHHPGTLDAGLLPARASTCRACRRRRAEDGPARPGVPQRRERSPPHPRHLRGGGRAAAPGPPGRAPVGDREWIERQGTHDEGLFVRWPRLAPQLLEWQAATLG